MKKVIAYLHTHWDREWYREFEVFRFRLIRVFDRVLDMLESGKIPSFYFDGHVAALLDYLEIRPEKETLVRKLTAEKKLFIGPFYCLVDEFLTDKICFEKNLEMGIKIARDFGCEDFIGYLADTFGHSQNVPKILKEFGVDKCMVWRGLPCEIPADFTWCGAKTVNLVRGYFMDTFSAPISIEEKAKLIKDNLDKIAEKSGDTLLLPIGADHLGVELDIAEQIEGVNEFLNDYEIVLSNPFEYFEAVAGVKPAHGGDEPAEQGATQYSDVRVCETNSTGAEAAQDKFPQYEWNDELRSNECTFILPGCYSARLDLKKYNAECSYKLALAQKSQKGYDKLIEYAYKLLLQNQAHDGICGCGTDAVHRENTIRYEKILQIANELIHSGVRGAGLETSDLEAETPICEDAKKNHSTIQPFNYSTYYGFDPELLYDTQRIPITEDWKEIPIKVPLPAFEPAQVEVKNGGVNVQINGLNKENFIEFVRYKDHGDTYNFGAVADDSGTWAKINSFDGDILHTDFFDVQIKARGGLLYFNIDLSQTPPDTLQQIKFNLPEPVTKTLSEDMNTLIERHFDPSYDIRKNLPQTRGLEAKTNTAPMQRFVWAQGFGVITKGLTEYEISGNSLLVTLSRTTGVISNPKNPSRSTPAGPPIPVPEAQKAYSAEFAIGFFAPEDYMKYLDEFYSV